MLGIWQRLKRLLCLSDSLGASTSIPPDVAAGTPIAAVTNTPIAAATTNRPSIPKPESKIDDLGFLELVSGTDPLVE